MIQEIEEIEMSDVSIDDLLDNEIIVYNDDHNSFEWVIECFCNYLKIDSLQAEQLAVIIDGKGKASVKKGKREILEPIATALTDAGLSAEIR